MRAEHNGLVAMSPKMEQSAYLPAMRRILAGWARLYDAASSRGDAAPLHRFTERTHLGLLSASAWAAGHEAYEEVGVDKSRQDAPSSGRCDLILHVDDHPLYVEAKRSRPFVGSDTEVISAFSETVRKKLRAARMDARRTLQGNRRRRRISLVFVTPRLRSGAKAMWPKLTRDLIVEAREWAGSHKHVDFLAMWTPETLPGEGANFHTTPKAGAWIPMVLAFGKMHSRVSAEKAA